MNQRDELGPSPYQRAMKKVAALEAEIVRLRTELEHERYKLRAELDTSAQALANLGAEIKRLKFLNQEEGETIEELSKLLSEALEHVLEHHGWFSSTAKGAGWIKKAREAIAQELTAAAPPPSEAD